ncbi:MAG: benzoyl-CoA reductase subunit C [Candidatus Krumholzibacteria bacterium]|nr:benzoyl-CoA reductase subunit C [Candidatus Krumholzibacteria bacterium]
MKVSEIVARCEELYSDLHLSYVKEWKRRNKRKAIGYMPIYVPRQIIHAAGMLPVGIMGAGDTLEIIRGDAYYQSYICHIPRSTIELGLTGRLDCLDGLLFPAICDVIRNLSGMWQLMFADKYVKYMDFPQNFNESIGGEFYARELEQLREDLVKMGNKPVGVDELNESIIRYNANAKAIKDLYALRSDAPHRVPTYELYLLMRASNILEVSEHTSLVEEYLSAVGKEDRQELDNIRVIVTGVFCEQPPLGLIRALEHSGCYIVDDDWVLGARFIDRDIEVGDDPIRALATGYIKHGVATSSRYIDQEEKGRHLLDRVEELSAEGVIFASPSFCDPALLERPMLQAALSKSNIPYTSFKFGENSGQYQVIKEQTGTFSDSIKLWGTA